MHVRYLPDTVVHRAAQITDNRQALINDFILTIFEHWKLLANPAAVAKADVRVHSYENIPMNEQYCNAWMILPCKMLELVIQ